jgi:thioredoxin
MLPRRETPRQPTPPGSYYILYSNGGGQTRQSVFDQRAIRREEVTGKLPDVTDGTFQSEVLDAEQPVLVDFWAPWCGPCRVVAPELQKVAARQAGQAIVVKVNTDELSDLGQRFGIRSIPTLAVFAGGKEVARESGARPAAEIEAFIARARAAVPAR